MEADRTAQPPTTQNTPSNTRRHTATQSLYIVTSMECAKWIARMATVLLRGAGAEGSVGGENANAAKTAIGIMIGMLPLFCHESS